MSEKPMGRIIPVTKWEKYHDYPTLSGFRWLIFHEHKNGLAPAIIRVGKKVLVDEDAFFEWLRSQRGKLRK